MLVVGFVNIHTHQAEQMLEYFEHEAQPWVRRATAPTRPSTRTSESADGQPHSPHARAGVIRPCTTTCSSTEVVRFAFMLGVAVSMLLYERRHLTTGSIVVPGYIATFILYPMIVAATFVNALVSYLLVNKVLRRWFLLYGRTKFTVLALDLDPDPDADAEG